MKKRIIISIFLLVILVTAVFFGYMAVDSYLYDMDPKNGVDMLEGVNTFLAIVIGGFIIWYEIDLFYTLYYFCVKPKTVLKSIINILANLSLTFVIACFLLDALFVALGRNVEVVICIFLSYIILRAVYLVICAFSDKAE